VDEGKKEGDTTIPFRGENLPLSEKEPRPRRRKKKKGEPLMLRSEKDEHFALPPDDKKRTIAGSHGEKREKAVSA